MELDFSYADGDHYDGLDVVQVDPRLTIVGYHADDLGTIECGLFGMAVGDGTSYVGRTGFLWYELNGTPVDYGASNDQQWVLRHKPFDDLGNIPTHTNIVRANANTWVLTSRTLAEGSDPAHFASLQKTGAGRGNKATSTTFSLPIMPVQIVLWVDCGGDCPVPGGD